MSEAEWFDAVALVEAWQGEHDALCVPYEAIRQIPRGERTPEQIVEFHRMGEQLIELRHRIGPATLGLGLRDGMVTVQNNTHES